MIFDNLFYIAFLWMIIVMVFPKGDNRIRFVLALLPLVYIAMFRFGAGIDYFSYEMIYNSQDVSTFGRMLDSQNRYEVGFRTAIYTLRKMNLPFQYFAAIFSLIILIVFSIWIYKHSKQPVLSLLIYYGMFFLVWNLSALRQGFVLAIGTYLFFSEDKPLTKWYQQLIAVVLLSLIHYSAVFYLVILVFDHFTISRKYLLLMLGVSLVVTLLPMKKIIEALSFIPLTKKFLRYASDGRGFLDFPGIMRLGFALYSLFLLYRYKWTRYQYKIISFTVLGFVFYFLIKFNEVFAGRFSAFTFLLMPIIFVWHLEKLTFKPLRISFTTALVLFSVIYFQKDAISMQTHQGIIEPTKLLKFTPIYAATTEDYWKYANEFTTYTYYYRKSRESFFDFHKNHKIDIQPYDKNKGYYVAKSPITRQFGVMNDEGKWVVYPNYSKKPTLHGDVLQEYVDGGVRNIAYTDLYGHYKDQNALNDAVYESLIRQRQVEEDISVFSKPSIESVMTILEQVLPSAEVVDDVSLMTFSKPFTYHIMQLKYFNRTFFVYLDAEMNLLSNNLYLDMNRFDAEGILKAKNFFSTDTINKEGVVIYHE